VGVAYRIAVALMGAGIVGIGLVLLPLPGPGWLIIFAGLGVLASEFSWARRLLDFARQRVEAWGGWVRRQGAAVRLVVGAVTLLALVAVGAGYLAWRGVPPWVPGIG